MYTAVYDSKFHVTWNVYLGEGVPLSLVPYGEHRCKNDVHKVELS